MPELGPCRDCRCGPDCPCGGCPKHRTPAVKPAGANLAWCQRNLIVAVALPMRLANIGSYSGKGDEGIRAEQLLLVAAGFRPVKDVFASQLTTTLVTLLLPTTPMPPETLHGLDITS